MPRLVVATFNVHGGVDGWGRPFDVVDACRRVEADVLMLQECWSPDSGESIAQRVANQLGYETIELPFARGRIAAPPDGAGDRWGPRMVSRSLFGLRLDRPRSTSTERRAKARGTLPKAQRGTWTIAVLSKFPVTGSQTIDLGKLPTDLARRGAIVADLDVAGAASSPVRVVCTHLAHLSQGSPRHIANLRRTLNAMTPAPSVLAGDMNLWGPPLVLLLPGWSRAVRGRTWPTWWRFPIAQPDHILVRDWVRVEAGEVLPITESDHQPVRAAIVID